MCNMSLALSTLVQCPEQWHPIYVCLINRSQIELNSNISICDEETTHTYTRIRHKIGKYKWAPLLCAERNPSPFSSTLLWQFGWHIWNLSVFEVLLKLICMIQQQKSRISLVLSQSALFYRSFHISMGFGKLTLTPNILILNFSAINRSMGSTERSPI